MTSITTRSPLDRLLKGSATDSMEVAKDIVGDRVQIDHATLAQIGGDKQRGKWARIAAIYALGLVGEAELAGTLRRVLSDVSDDLKVREHAAEALGNIGDQDSLSLLQTVLTTERSPKLRRSCEYALRELATL